MSEDDGSCAEENPAPGEGSRQAGDAASVPTGDGSEQAVAREPYVFDAQDAGTAARVLDRAFAGPETSMLHGRLARDASQAEGLPQDGPLAFAVGTAGDFVLQMDSHAGSPGCTLEPQFETDRFAFPMRLGEIPDSFLQLWEAAAPLCASPAASARLHDLLFLRRHGRPGDHADQAITDYLEAADSVALDLESAAWLLRAWTLSRQARRFDRLAAIEELIVARAAAELQSTAETPGVVLPLLHAVASTPMKGQPERAPGFADSVDDAIESAAASYVHGYLVGETMDLLRTRTKDATRLAKIDRREVAAHVAEADRSTSGFVRQHHLTEAIRVARDRGLTPEAEAATVLLQAIPMADLELKSHVVNVSIPSHVPELFLLGFTCGRSWRDGLDYFLTTAAPSGKSATLREVEQETRTKNVFSRMVTHTRLMEHGLPKAVAEPGSDAAAAAELASLASPRAMHTGLLLGIGLQRVAERYELPGELELTTYLMERLARDKALARSLARGLILFWEGRFEEATHLVTPKIEAAARAVLRESDMPLFRIQTGQSLGGYVGLDATLRLLEELALDPDWAFFLRWLLLDPGMNLRNDVAHGLLGDADATISALALRAAALMILVAPDTTDPGWDHATDGRRPARWNAENSRVVTDKLLRDPTGRFAHGRRRLLSRPGRQLGAVLRAVAGKVWRIGERLS